VPAFSFSNMLSQPDTLIASDSVNNIDLLVTEKGQVYLYLQHEKPATCYLNYPFLADMLKAIGRRRISLHVEPAPEIPGVTHEIPIIAFVCVANRVVLACIPTLKPGGDAEAIFKALPWLPMIVSNCEVLANRQLYERVMSVGRN
jgi:hypothetical protein